MALATLIPDGREITHATACTAGALSQCRPGAGEKSIKNIILNKSVRAAPNTVSVPPVLLLMKQDAAAEPPACAAGRAVPGIRQRKVRRSQRNCIMRAPECENFRLPRTAQRRAMATTNEFVYPQRKIQGNSQMLFYAFYAIAAVVLILHFTGWLKRNRLEWMVLVVAVAVFPVVIFLR
jgi:hypothetical protein